jgi:DNA helicase-2/ATP-dependent DNA helicase PcrA
MEKKRSKKFHQDLFEKSFSILNKEQKEAVENIEGPVTVVAGPGTGKTQILTLRIANILKEMGSDFAPNILALTFTNSGVHAMRKRLVEFVGVELAYQVSIFTFHSFAEDQIKKNPEVFKDFSFSRPISDIEKIEIIEDILNRSDLKALQTFSSDFHYTQKIISAIDNLKSEAFTPEDFKKTFPKIEERILQKEGENAFYKINRGEAKKGEIKKEILAKIEKQKEKQKELLGIFIDYQEKLKELKLYDFSDMILSVVFEAENDNDFRVSLQENFLYLLVDEHQDTNNAQSKIIEIISSASINENRPNIFTVGDQKQAIYRFQGASLENFTSFREKYSDVKIINLDKNYRSSQNILDS